MENMTLKTKTIICVSLFLILFGVLLTVASIFDYQVSEILTKNALEEGAYHSSDIFGVAFEIFGCNTMYLMIMFCTSIMFWFCIKVFNKKPLNIIGAVLFAVGTVVAAWFIYKDAVSYIFDQVNRVSEYTKVDEIYELRHSAPIVLTEIVLAIFTAVPFIFATKYFKEETLKKLFWFAIASACVMILANVLMGILKGPMGRMRFRAINCDLGSALISSGQAQGYTPWYVVNGQNDALNELFFKTYSVKDAFKSYPSGHTSSAGSIYCLIMLPSVITFKNQKLAKGLCWGVSLLWTGLVAISRIVVGAHYFSDVLFGGTLSFASVIIFREIFICKGSHFFAVFPKANKSKTKSIEE